MKRLPPKRPRLRLNAESYSLLRQRVLQRDDWRCQRCGAMSELEVHHQQSRGYLGDDSESNLITLCHRCHAKLHLRSSRPNEQDKS